jgi:hypothetical protein
MIGKEFEVSANNHGLDPQRLKVERPEDAQRIGVERGRKSRASSGAAAELALTRSSVRETACLSDIAKGSNR